MSPDRCTTHHICDCRQAMLGEAQHEVKAWKHRIMALQEIHNRERKRLEATIATLLKALGQSKIPHLVVDGDCWFSCPKSGECCDDSRSKGGCECGADAHNERIVKALAKGNTHVR